MIRDASTLLVRLRAIHEAIRNAVVATCEQNAIEQLSAIVAEQAGDTIFAIDRISEEVLLSHFAELGQDFSFVLIAEGLHEDGLTTFPQGTDPLDAELRIIIDPIDGTRGLMYQKRSAWILTGVASNQGPSSRLTDIELALQTEIPLVKQHLSDSFWAIAGQGVQGERYNRLTGDRQALQPRPSREATIAQGYGSIARFFPGGRGELATIDDELIKRVLGPGEPGKAQAFEDQYICTGGQLYELLMGHDRWLADIRPLMMKSQELGLCCHPYDLCTELIAREAGILVTNEYGKRLVAPLDVTTNMSWLGYANEHIYQQVNPILQELFQQHNLLKPDVDTRKDGVNDDVAH